MTIPSHDLASTPLSRGVRRCAWSGADADDVEAIEAPAVDRFGRDDGRKVYWVRPRYRPAFLSWNAVVVRWGRWYLPMVAVCIAIMVAAAALAGLPGLGGGVLLLGLLFVIMPSATPETVDMLGIRNSMLVVRAMAIAMVVGGILLIALPAR